MSGAGLPIVGRWVDEGVYLAVWAFIQRQRSAVAAQSQRERMLRKGLCDAVPHCNRTEWRVLRHSRVLESVLEPARIDMAAPVATCVSDQ